MITEMANPPTSSVWPPSFLKPVARNSSSDKTLLNGQSMMGDDDDKSDGTEAKSDSSKSGAISLAIDSLVYCLIVLIHF